jgi:hypothetical protein
VDGQDDEPSESRITVMRQAAGTLAPVGLVTGLGRTEEIYGVRYVGDIAFVVTFRQTDPLYTVDLAEPTHPRVVGELKIPGFSTYLHPVAEDMLLGIGQSATDEGETRGTQLSLFDVGDLVAPRRVANLELGPDYYSLAEYDHRAFLFWPPTGLVVVPLTRQTEFGDSAWSGAGAFRVGGATLAPVTRITHRRETPIQRSLVSGERLLTVSDRGVMSSRLADAGDGRWLAFE